MTSTRDSTAPPRQRRLGAVVAPAIVAIVIVAIAGTVGFLLSERGLPFLVAHVVDRSDGRIEIEGSSGSLAGTMHFARIRWRGASTTVIADDVVVAWNPRALWSSRLSIRGLGAAHVEITSRSTSTEAPTDLRLPIAIDIDRLEVGELDWRTASRSGHLSGITLGYAGDETRHRIRNLSLVSPLGRLRADLSVGARAPLPVEGRASLDGDGTLAGVRATALLDGPLERIDVSARGSFGDITLSLQTVATLFAREPFATAAAELTGIDAASLDASLPYTALRAHATFEPQGEGVAGALEIVNDAPGPVDAQRLPIARLASRFALADEVLQLAALDATLGDGGVRGEARIALDAKRPAAQLTLDVANVDLARIDSRLVRTRLSGRVSANASDTRQTIEGDVRDRDLTLAFAATAEGGHLDIARFRAATAAGSLAGTAGVSLDETNAFTAHAVMQHLDPSRFLAVPRASIDGKIDARGVLRPSWRATLDILLAKSSTIDRMAVSGKAKGTVARNSVRDATLDVALGSARLAASGSWGSGGDRATFQVDVPRLADIAAILPGAVPQPATGEVHVRGHVVLAQEAIGGDIDGRANALRVGPYAAGTMQVHASIAPPTAAAGDAPATRAIGIDFHATQLTLDKRAFDDVRLRAGGSLASHHARLAVRGGEIDATLALDGGFHDPVTSASWSGTLAALENRGAFPVRLRGAASVAFHRDYLRVADAHVDVADGRADVGEFVWDAGRMTTHGAFTGIPVASAARIAGVAMPLESTLIAGGDWSIAASPRLRGRFSARRESGDIMADVSSPTGTRRESVGVTALAIAGTLKDDALDAQASFASTRAGTASVSVAIGSVDGAAPGRIDPRGPLRLTARAELASLGVLQPWIGTEAAIHGRAALDITAHGTISEPLWSGTIAADALQLDAPAYGLQVSDGRVRAHLVPSGIALDEARFTGGDGTFTATGSIAIPGERSGAATRVTWKAARFRIANRPDLRFVIDGDGTLALEHRKLALHGNIVVVEGHVEYDPSPTGRLASDIVIEGAPERARSAAADVPLLLGVDVDLGRDLTFAGEGLEARLAGRVAISTGADGHLRGRGTIRAVNGSYFAFGQKLTIDRGRVIFDGPLANPALDVVALRKNLPVEAGVALTGTMKNPQARITSNPPVPENEALAWLVTGQGLNAAGRVDYAALSAASAALLGRNGKPFTADIARRFGLDEITLQSSGTASGAASGTASQVVVFGKRISDRLSLGYEQGLSLATSALRLEYALSRGITLRAEAGTASGVGIVYRRSFR